MEYHIFSSTGLVLAAAYFIAGVFDAVCGGGGLVTIPILMTLGVPIHSVAPTNQCSMTLGSVTSFLRYVRSGKIYWLSALIAAPFSVIGAFVGAKLNLFMPEQILKMIMLILIPIIAVVVFFKRDMGTEDNSDTLSKPMLAVWSVAIGLIVGAYQGFYGAGSGAFFLLGFAVLIRLDLVTASGCAKLVIMCAVVTASITYALSGQVIWLMVLTGMFFNIAGNYVGAGLALTKGAKIIRPMFMLVLVGLVIKLVTDLI